MTELTRYVAELPAGQERLFTISFQNSQWHRLCERAKVPFLKFHALRSCMSTWLQDSNVATSTVARILGHSSERVTSRHYTAPLDMEAKRRAVERLPLPPLSHPHR